MRLMLTGRPLARGEIESVWTIDRSEVVEHAYVLENGALRLVPRYFDIKGWPPGEAERYTPLLIACFDRGGWFHGLFDAGSLIGVAILDTKPIGHLGDRLQLKFLHVSNAYRGRGLGGELFELAKQEAATRGAKYLYISATPSQNTIDFYLRRGSTVTREPDPELFALEPDDIHLECAVSNFPVSNNEES